MLTRSESGPSPNWIWLGAYPLAFAVRCVAVRDTYGNRVILWSVFEVTLAARVGHQLRRLRTIFFFSSFAGADLGRDRRQTGRQADQQRCCGPETEKKQNGRRLSSEAVAGPGVQCLHPWISPGPPDTNTTRERGSKMLVSWRSLMKLSGCQAVKVGSAQYAVRVVVAAP